MQAASIHFFISVLWAFSGVQGGIGVHAYLDLLFLMLDFVY